MSIGSDIREEANQADGDASRSEVLAAFPTEAIPYLLSTADAFVILASSLTGGISYELLSGYPIPDLVPYCAVGLLASFIHILRMSGTGYYEFAESAKPRVEITEILLC